MKSWRSSYFFDLVNIFAISVYTVYLSWLINTLEPRFYCSQFLFEKKTQTRFLKPLMITKTKFWIHFKIKLLQFWVKCIRHTQSVEAELSVCVKSKRNTKLECKVCSIFWERQGDRVRMSEWVGESVCESEKH